MNERMSRPRRQFELYVVYTPRTPYYVGGQPPENVYNTIMMYSTFLALFYAATLLHNFLVFVVFEQ